MASDSSSPSNVLAFFPDIQKQLDATCKEVLSKVANPGFQYSKERVFITEAFFNENPHLPEKERRDIVALIKDVGNSRMLKTRLREWESSTGGSSSWLSLSTLKSLFVSKEQTSRIVEDAASRSRNMKDLEFLMALQEKVFQEPLLEQFAQEVVKDAHLHFREFMERRLPKLYSRAHEIKQQMMYRQVELGEKKQDQERRTSLRSNWVDEIKSAQIQASPGYASC